jgi:hypothetical protein
MADGSNESQLRFDLAISHQPSAISHYFSHHSHHMARGFESKDVEYQQAEAERSRTRNKPRTAEQREADARRRTLELSLSRAEAELRAATSPVHRRMLEQALEALRERLTADVLNDVS